MTRGALSLLLCVAVTAAAGAGCGGGTAPRLDKLGLPLDRPVTQQEVRRLPDASLRYPGSAVVRVVGSDERKQVGEHEPDPAFAGAVAIAPVSVDVLLAWYDHQLTARGYRRATYYKLAGQPTGRAWTAPGNREQVQVGVYAAGSAATGPVPAGHVGYEAILVNYRATGPPPP
ncbi:MAG: hypothetical protein QOD07_2859 [Frankiaceae bacterium]|jgi:hypothetical protein|nr:hypothetical protein [Frankiaceae bacterium]